MKFNTTEEAILGIKNNFQISQLFLSMREKSKELKALVNGEGFIDELIDKIECIESEEKAKARKKYSRDIQDTFARIFQPIDNIYYATGGIRKYNVENDEIEKLLIKKLSSIRDNKSLSKWIQTKGIQIFNTDPNALVFLEYTTVPAPEVYPTYKSINSIRYYESHGQKVEFVIFEPFVINQQSFIRIVDDAWDRTFLMEGNNFILQESNSFEHPFGQCPALVCSDISHVGSKEKLPAIHNVLGLVKELARDQSILTLYKIFKGLPLFWKAMQYCGDCQGTGKIGDEKCGTCDGHGKYKGKNDVVDVIEVPIGEGDDKLLTSDNVGGWLSPEHQTWIKYEETIDKLEERLYKSHWGTSFGMRINGNIEKTATEVIFDKQPFENQLNKYADFAEHMEWKLTEWILNFYDPQKNKNESRVVVSLGRRYLIENYDVLLNRYENSVRSQTNSVVIDTIYEEFLQSKFRNNKIDLINSIKKSKVEPYLHFLLKDVYDMFGQEEAQRKVLFNDFWKQCNTELDVKTLKEQYDEWFDKNKKIVTIKTI